MFYALRTRIRIRSVDLASVGTVCVVVLIVCVLDVYCLCTSTTQAAMRCDAMDAQTSKDIVAEQRFSSLSLLSVWFAWFVGSFAWKCHGAPWVLTCVAELPAEVPTCPMSQESQLTTVPRCRLPRAWPLFFLLASSSLPSPILNSALPPQLPSLPPPPPTNPMHGWPHSLVGLNTDTF